MLCVQSAKQYTIRRLTIALTVEQRWKEKITMPMIKKKPKDRHFKIGTKCLICDEFIKLNELESYAGVVKICDKCKKAVMRMRDISDEPSGDKDFYASERYENMSREQEFIDQGRMV